MRTLAAVAVAGVLLVGAVVYVVGFTGLLGVRSVEVYGSSAVSAREVRDAAAVPVGEPLARLDVGTISRRVGQVPGIQLVRVSRSWPSTVRIDVVERTPVAVVPRGSGLWLVDVEGVLFQRVPVAPAWLPRLVVARPVATDPASRAALTVIAALPTPLRRLVQVVEAPTPDSVTLGLRDGRTVVWGGPGESDTKARVLAPLLSRPGSTYDVSTPSVIVLR
ncbi:MAG TPA: FtsQ-type POTRA domain-containing protein [Mycobacteriales bacterium]|nr:FtsQ-type POTRA domain-containing protein [Mycobacteriales bacterium]